MNRMNRTIGTEHGTRRPQPTSRLQTRKMEDAAFSTALQSLLDHPAHGTSVDLLRSSAARLERRLPWPSSYGPAAAERRIRLAAERRDS
jgi:hypothetical protein